MKTLKAVSFILAIGSITFADNLPRTVDIPLKEALVPSGFDDNDRSQFVVAGTLPNSCYRVGPHALRIDEAQNTITLQQQAYLYGGLCLQMVIPFTQVVDLGIVKQGEYQLLDRESGKSLGAIVIGKSKNEGPDDYLYAPVEDASITSDGGKYFLNIKGTFVDRCSVLEEVRVLYQGQVLVAQPIMKRLVDENSTCGSPGKTRFMKTVELTGNLKGVRLLHVRSLEGQAINKIIDLP